MFFQIRHQDELDIFEVRVIFKHLVSSLTGSIHRGHEDNIGERHNLSGRLLSLFALLEAQIGNWSVDQFGVVLGEGFLRLIILDTLVVLWLGMSDDVDLTNRILMLGIHLKLTNKSFIFWL